MPINYLNYISNNITANTVVYTPNTTNVQATIVGMIICNNTANTAIANVKIISSTTSANIISNLSIPAGLSLNVVDASKIIVQQNNSIAVTSSQSVDVVISSIEVS
jgi:hypothetical protein